MHASSTDLPSVLHISSIIWSHPTIIIKIIMVVIPFTFQDDFQHYWWHHIMQSQRRASWVSRKLTTNSSTMWNYHHHKTSWRNIDSTHNYALFLSFSQIYFTSCGKGGTKNHTHIQNIKHNINAKHFHATRHYSYYYVTAIKGIVLLEEFSKS